MKPANDRGSPPAFALDRAAVSGLGRLVDRELGECRRAQVREQARRVECEAARADLAAERAVLRLERPVAAEQRAEALALRGVLLRSERELALDDRERVGRHAGVECAVA